MADTAASISALATTPKKAKAAASENPRTKPSSDNVNAVMNNLKERCDSSRQAMKKYISANYKVDAEKLVPFILKYLKSAVASGALTHPKGKGASGSFNLSVKCKGKAVSAGQESRGIGHAERREKTVTEGTKKTDKKLAVAKKFGKPKTLGEAKKVSKPPTNKKKSPKHNKAAVKKPKTPKKVTAKMKYAPGLKYGCHQHK